MFAHIKTMFVEALRSGEYKQTVVMLHNRDCFCLMGVLCDLYLKEKKLDWQVDIWGNQNINGHCSLLPYSVIEWAGIAPGNNCEFFGIPERIDYNNRPCYSLSSLNDAGMPFVELADLVEKYF